MSRAWLALLLGLPAPLQAAGLSRVRVEQDAQGLVHVRYRLDAPDPSRFYVRLRLSQDRGSTFLLEPQSVTGDAGAVSERGEKHAVWDVGRDHPELLGDDYVMAVAAAEAKRTAAPPRALVDWVDEPGGTLLAGSRPRRWVSVKPFQLAQRPATFGQYERCVAAGACTAAHAADNTCWLTREWGHQQGVLPAPSQGQDQPAVCLTWEQARSFAEWAGGRLPSGAEWESAARRRGLQTARPAAGALREWVQEPSYPSGYRSDGIGVRPARTP